MQSKWLPRRTSSAVFAGARICPEEIRPDLTKLTVVDWQWPAEASRPPEPRLTGYFRPLIKEYAKIAQPRIQLES
jgi:hypothetical protein